MMAARIGGARSTIVSLLRLGLGVLLIVAGTLKLRDPAAFAVEVANFQLLPALSPYLAATLPAVELVLGIGLMIFPAPWRRAAAVGTAILLGMFAVAVSSAVLRDINITCGCFGGGGDTIGPLTILRNLSLLIAVAALLALDRPS